MLQRYLDTRQKIEVEANSIFSITSILELLVTCGDDKLEVDPIALGTLNRMLNTNILNIWEILENYIPMVQAKLDLGVFED
jgi:hypothetical protein